MGILRYESWKRKTLFLTAFLLYGGYWFSLHLIHPEPAAIVFLLPAFGLPAAFLFALSSGENHLIAAARRGELGQTLFLPNGPMGVALASGLLTWLLMSVLFFFTLIVTGWEAGSVVPRATSDLTRLSVYLSFAVAAPFSGIATLAGAVGVAYKLGRVETLLAGFTLVGLLELYFVKLSRLPILWQGPRVPVSDFRWLIDTFTPQLRLSFPLLPSEWPLTPALAGFLTLAFGIALASQILSESEV